MGSEIMEGVGHMTSKPGILVGKGEEAQVLRLDYANRHGLIAGATGTGKTVTLQVLAEGFSKHGVPVFLADVKGDLAGLSRPGTPKDSLMDRAKALGITDYEFQGYPTVFWDLFGEQGHPIRTTISDMGPLLLSRLLGLNETQEGVLNVAFKVADDQGLLLLDLKDLRSVLNFVSDNAGALTAEYGTVRKVSVGAILRRLLVIEQQGGELFFGEPALELSDLMRTDSGGYGQINILAADKLMQYPKLYATFMLWLVSELFEELPEIGDPDKPRLVFFFDEAHLLFEDAPKVLIDKVELVARLIRSKGVGIYFISQNPLDIPEDILGQLGNRVQHALRAYTPRDQKAVKAAADTFRANPKLDSAEAIKELGVGEALVSTLEDQGVPGIVQRVQICPPSSRMGPVSPEERQTITSRSPLGAKYDQMVDRESAYEVLKDKASQAEESLETRTPAHEPYERPHAPPRQRPARTSSRQTVVEAFAKSVVRSIGSSLGRKIVRGILGSIFKGR